MRCHRYVWNLIVGRPWQFDEGVWYDRRANAYLVEKGGWKLQFLPIEANSIKFSAEKMAFLSVSRDEIIQAYKANYIVLALMFVEQPTL